MKKLILYLACLNLLCLSSIICQVSILGPATLAGRMRNYETPSIGKFNFKIEGLDFKLGNFGEIPYGKTVVGYIFYSKHSDGTNDWCDFEKTSTPANVAKDPDNDYSPIFLVDYTDDCSLLRKAYNVRARGGRVMLLVSNDRTFKDRQNVDDRLGSRVDIPTIILKKDEGEEIKSFINSNRNEKVVMSIKFTGMKNADTLTMELFMSSDNLKSLHFFKEFKQYYDILKNKMSFVPHYKYYKYTWEVTSNVVGATDSDAPCVKDTKYCAHENHNLKVYNPRIILMENIRQSCIFSTYSTENMDLYWKYMINFSDTCADHNVPLFTEECANDMMKYTGIDSTKITKCMDDAIKSIAGVIETDYTSFSEKKVLKTPEVMLNGIKYKGSWLAKYVFDAICTGFIDDDSICATPKPEDFSKTDSGISIGGILLITVFIVLAMIVLLVCYRRIVNKSLEASLNEKIQTQTIHSLGQYQVFKDESTGRKSVDVTKL